MGTAHYTCFAEAREPRRSEGFRGTTKDLDAISSQGTGEGEFLWPASLIIDRNDTLYLSDEATHRISAFSTGGDYLSSWGEHGDADGQLNRPSGIAFDPDENVYVVDTLNHRVQKFTKDGRFLLKFGALGDGDGQFNMPWGIAADELGDVYVVDWRNDRVQKFSAAGEFVFKIGTSGSGDGQFNRPAGVAVDNDGDIYVADSGNDRVQLFDAEGRYVEKLIGDATLSKMGRTYLLSNARPLRLREMTVLEPQKRLRGPRSMHVDDQGRLFIPDYGSYRVQVYQKDAIPLAEGQISPPLRSPSLMVT